MVQNLLNSLSGGGNRGWNFEVPQINNLLEPIQQGVRDYRAAEQRQVENQRAERGLAIQEGQFGLQKRNADRADQEARLSRFGKAATAIAQMQGPQQAQAWQRLMSGHADLAPEFAKYGVDPADARNASMFIAKSWGEYDPLAQEQKRAAINASNASAALASANAKNVGLTDPIREFNFAKSQGFAGTFEDFKKQNANTNAAQQITWGKDASGNYVPMQATRDGRLIQSQMPGGVTAVPSPEMAELKAAATERGKALGTAQVDLPAVENSADFMLKAIEAVENLTNLEGMTGWRGNLPNVTPGARDAQAKIDQIQGKVFLQAFNSLRGGGAITEAEGAKATFALSRLQETRAGTPEYRQALADVRAEVLALRDVARRKAGVAPQAAPQQGGVNTDGVRRSIGGKNYVLRNGQWFEE